eukprot:112010-Ditylum_brightwellii.AAC.1
MAAAIKKAKRSNTIVMASFTMAFTGESLIGMVYATMMTDWPSGLAYKIVVALPEKYASQDMVTKIELRCALNSILMKRKDDPVVLFEQISGLQNRYNTTTFQISSEEQIATVLDKAPTEYSTVLTCKQRQKGSALSMTDLQLAMTQLYCTMYGDVRGYNCGGKGHKAFQYKEPKKKKNNKIQIRSVAVAETKVMKMTTAGTIQTTQTRSWPGTCKRKKRAATRARWKLAFSVGRWKCC